MISKVPTNGHSSNTHGQVHGKVELNEALWATEDDQAVMVEDVWVANVSAETREEESKDSEDHGPPSLAEESTATENGEGILDVPEEINPTCPVEPELIEDNKLFNSERESATEVEEALKPEEKEEEAVSDTKEELQQIPEIQTPLLDKPTVASYVSGRPALRGGSPFHNASFCIKSEPSSPNPATAFPRLRKADALSSLVMSPGKRSHDDSSSSAAPSESAAKRICKNWLPTGLTRWWSHTKTDADEDQENPNAQRSCSLM